ncbi:MAG TPA: hypothetical protein VHX86_06270 [Tepidisphaeraceae bacterium]|jgi:hypothetical protein|nr:hypothetical protein [Tepidisphaeraceae bacterium]
MITSDQIVERMKAEIVGDVKEGIVPANVASFLDLHNFVDANCYGGAEEIFGEFVTESATDHEHQAKLDIVNSLITPAIEATDAWIKAGGIETALTLERVRAKPKGMKVTVYRPKELIGLGAPQAFLDDDHPKQGDWHQSAKAELLEGDPHMRLHQMGRDFLIYSMYHAREPRFLGYAVENFGAACKKLGYELPLTESDAVWLTYTKNEIEPAPPDEQQFLLSQIATVFGTKAAQEQADALGVRWPSRLGPTQSGPMPRHR